MEKKKLVIVAIFVVVLIAFVGVISYEQGKKSEESGGTAWISRQETVKQVSFELGAREDKYVQFFLPTSSAWREMEFSVDVESSGDVDVVLWQYEDEDWNKKIEWKGVSSLNQSFSYYDGGYMRLEVVNGSINIFNSKDISVEIARSWKEQE